MSQGRRHVTVCICTFRRLELILRLLRALERQTVDDTFRFSIVVVDNDADGSACRPVSEHAATSQVSVRYGVEATRNIALARNAAVEQAKGDFVAFIDDDEFPVDDWLKTLLETADKYGADAVLGPVRPHFESPPPRWIIEGGFFERPEYATGRIIRWSEGRTGNLMVRRSAVDALGRPFDPRFGSGGEDMDFLRRLSDCGKVFVWCNDAAVYETVPPARWKRSYLVRRALLRGRNIMKHPHGGLRLRLAATSVLAVPIYVLALPVALVRGHHIFMRHCIRLGDHLGRLLALAGLNPVRERDL